MIARNRQEHGCHHCNRRDTIIQPRRRERLQRIPSRGYIFSWPRQCHLYWWNEHSGTPKSETYTVRMALLSTSVTSPSLYCSFITWLWENGLIGTRRKVVMKSFQVSWLLSSQSLYYDVIWGSTAVKVLFRTQMDEVGGSMVSCEFVGRFCGWWRWWSWFVWGGFPSFALRTNSIFIRPTRRSTWKWKTN